MSKYPYPIIQVLVYDKQQPTFAEVCELPPDADEWDDLTYVKTARVNRATQLVHLPYTTLTFDSIIRLARACGIRDWAPGEGPMKPFDPPGPTLEDVHLGKAHPLSVGLRRKNEDNRNRHS